MTTSLIFPSWWQALAAVPPSKTARDWWAPEDARSPRYDRLYRVWGDPTDDVPPPYYKAEKEKHLVPTLWENFSIFHPADIVSSLYKVLQFECADRATDLCWSCEFNLGHQDRQLDIVMHVRFGDRDEVLLGEAKAERKRFDDKDLQPHCVLRHKVFASVATTRYFLLGDAVIPEDWHTRGYGHLTWLDLLSIQFELCDILPESSEVRQLIRELIRSQFAGHGIVTGPPVLGTSIDDLQAFAIDPAHTAVTDRCRNFIHCAIQHIRCLTGLASDSIPISYLAEEPRVEQIVPRWRLGCGGREVNEKPYWKIPPRSK